MRMRMRFFFFLATEYMADAKRKRAAGVEPEKGDYVRLSPSVEDFMGGKRYCKESELTRCRLLAYERSQGRISECVQLVRVTVATLDGKTDGTRDIVVSALRAAALRSWC